MANHDYRDRSDLSADEVRAIEAANGFRQLDYANTILTDLVVENRPVEFKPRLVRELQAIAIEGLVRRPGELRSEAVGIEKSDHQPPSYLEVEHLVEEMCQYVNHNWHDKTAYYLAAFVMWRQNWIHPFVDGNGRTSRALSYIVLNAKLNAILPGSPTIPEQIAGDRSGYFDALEAADKSNSDVKIDGDFSIDFELSKMEDLIKGMLATQLLSVVNEADQTN